MKKERITKLTQNTNALSYAYDMLRMTEVLNFWKEHNILMRRYIS